MIWVVTEIKRERLGAAEKARTFGPYESEQAAEMARRDLHMEYVIADLWTKPRTYVSEVEAR